MDTDRNLLFGVLALQADLITNDQFAEACSAWAARKSDPLAELLVERGWLGLPDRADVEKLLERKLKKHGGDVRAFADGSDNQSCSAIVGRRRRPRSDAVAHAAGRRPRPSGDNRVPPRGPRALHSDATARHRRHRSSVAGPRCRAWVATWPSRSYALNGRVRRPYGGDSSKKRRSPASWNIPALCPSTSWASAEVEAAVLHHAVRRGAARWPRRLRLPRRSGTRRVRRGRWNCATCSTRSSACATPSPTPTRGRPSPRPEAAERRAGRLRRGHRPRLGPGQGDRPGRRRSRHAAGGLQGRGTGHDPRPGLGNAGVHAPEQAEGRLDLLERAHRCLRAGGHPLPDSHRATSLQ